MAKILVVVLDGVGFRDPQDNINLYLKQKEKAISSRAFWQGNAVNAAYTPNLFQLFSGSLFCTLRAHGKAVGLPTDSDAGNSEVGHNILGAGRAFAQGATLVNEAISSGRLFQGAAWKSCVQRLELQQGTQTLHLCSLLSDGNVHSHIDHLFACIRCAKNDHVKKVRLHILLDGRDVSPLSALDYVEKLEGFLANINDESFDCCVASGGGRSTITMDRYESNWKLVEQGYDTHVLGVGRFFDSATHAIQVYRQEQACFDQDLPAFVIAKEGIPVGPVNDGDSFLLLNFRGDRAIQLSRSLTEPDFVDFHRKRFPAIHFAGMMQYDGDRNIPALYLVEPPSIDCTLTELLSAHRIPQFACSETQKFGHVTYFWNGNRSGKFDANYECDVEVASDTLPFQERPWMKSAEITDITIQKMQENAFRVGRINFPNGDMVGHTGNFAASLVAIGALDVALGRLMVAAIRTNTVLVVTADHGNADDMYEKNAQGELLFDEQGASKVKTSHSLAPVPFAIYNEKSIGVPVTFRQDLSNASLANVAATVLDLLGLEPPTFYSPSLIEFSP